MTQNTKQRLLTFSSLLSPLKKKKSFTNPYFIFFSLNLSQKQYDLYNLPKDGKIRKVITVLTNYIRSLLFSNLEVKFRDELEFLEVFRLEGEFERGQRVVGLGNKKVKIFPV